MVEALPALPSILGGGTLAAVIFYLLKHVAGLYRQLGQAQAAVGEAASERAARVEQELAACRLRIAELEQRERDVGADWARRAAIRSQIRIADPEAVAKHAWVEKRIDEVLSEEAAHRANP